MKCLRCRFKTCLTAIGKKRDFIKGMCHKRIFKAQDRLVTYCTMQYHARKTVTTFNISVYFLT